MIAISRSTTVFDYKYKAKEEAKVRVLKGNKYFSKGIKGERIDKRTGEIESSCKKIKRIKGLCYTSLALTETMKRSIFTETFKKQQEQQQ